MGSLLAFHTMASLSGGLLDSTRVLLDLQQANEIAQSFSGCLEPEPIACCVAQGLVDRFRCAFARIWLLEPDQTMLRLVASAGMYTRTDGFFGRVPMGAYKVGKIAQNRVSFLSNNLPAEPWVGNRDWAVANQIRGFAGYPLAIGNRVIGVLAMFSHHPLEPEFLEVLQTLCTIVTIALDTAIQYQKEKQLWQLAAQPMRPLALSDQLAEILKNSRLTLLGTEQPLSTSRSYLVLKTAEVLSHLRCTYARLTYSDTTVALEAITPSGNCEATVPIPVPISVPIPTEPADPDTDPEISISIALAEIHPLVTGLGGILQTQPTSDQRATQITLNIPYAQARSELKLQVLCTSPLLQLAFTHLATTAGLTLCNDQDAPLLTDEIQAISPTRKVIWVSGSRSHPPDIQARVDFSLQPEQFRQAVEAVMQGQTWGIPAVALSDRELEILRLLTQGHRDRDIADQLVISESTVKFHLNNVLTKLKAKTRYQAVYKAIEQGWI